MGGRVSGYDTVAEMWRPEGAIPFEGQFRRGAPVVGASESETLWGTWHNFLEGIYDPREYLNCLETVNCQLFRNCRYR
jgi:hypothetical protein